MLAYAYSLIEPYSKNIVEHTTFIVGLQLIDEMRTKYLEACDLVQYHPVALDLADRFEDFYINHAVHF